MVNYANGVIYMIKGKSINKNYIGSTTIGIYKRLAGHKSSSNNCSSKEIIESGEYSIEVLEIYPTTSSYELRLRERFYIENNECVNKNIPTMTQTEHNRINRSNPDYRLKENANQKIYENKPERKIIMQSYRDNPENKKKALAYRKNYNEVNKEIIKVKNKTTYEAKKLIKKQLLDKIEVK